MKRRSLLILASAGALAACSGGDGANQSANTANLAAEEGLDPNMMFEGDEISPIPEAQDDMAANQSDRANPAGNAAAPPQPPVQPPPIPGAPPQGR